MMVYYMLLFINVSEKFHGVIKIFKMKGSFPEDHSMAYFYLSI